MGSISQTSLKLFHLKDGVNFEQFSAPLPEGVMQHCLVSLDNGGDLFVTGGHNGEVG